MHYDNLPPEIFFSRSISGFKPCGLLKNWDPKDNNILIKLVLHIKKCWNISQWDSLLEKLDETRNFLEITNTEIMENMECVIGVDTFKDSVSGRAMIRLPIAVPNISITLTMDINNGCLKSIKPFINHSSHSKMHITNSLYAPEHMNITNLETYIMAISKLCSSQLYLQRQSFEHRKNFIHTVIQLFSRFVVLLKYSHGFLNSCKVTHKVPPCPYFNSFFSIL